MKQKLTINPLRTAVCCLLVSGLAAGVAQASTNYFRFDSDPTSDFSLIASGGDNATLQGMAGVWFPADGSPLEPGVVDQGTNGYFAITQTTPGLTQHGMNSVIVFNDTDSGHIVVGFTFSCDVRIGAGNSTPADGFSLNYARVGDPVILTGNGFASGPNNTPSNAREEGTTTGLVISFDAYQNGAADTIGLTIKIDNTVITNLPLPTLNGDCNDITSLQTGTNTSHLVSDLCWQPLYVKLDPSGLLSVAYKGVTLVTNFQAHFAPSAGRLVFAGRTGGSYQEQDVDNIMLITVPSEYPVIGPISSTPFSWHFGISDSGLATPDTNSITVSIDGIPFVPTRISQNSDVGMGNGAGVTTVSYENAVQSFASGSEHTIVVHFTGGSSFSGAVNYTNVFTVAPVKGALDRVHYYLGQFQGVTRYSPDQAGHTGTPGDYAVDIGSPPRVANGVLSTESGLMNDMNNAALNDTLSFSFWIRHRNYSSTSALWAYSDGAPQNRGVNLHCPYYDDASETIFFDTGGTAGPSRISGLMTTFPAYSGSNSWWYTWHHIVAIKNGGDKQVWIDGQLFLTGTGQAVLYPDLKRLYIGSAIASLSVDGWIDDFAVYSTALSATDVTNLFTGTAPNAISASSSLLAWWDFNDAVELKSAQIGDKLVLTYTQVLQSSTNVAGPYFDVPNATSPYTNDITANLQMFFRTRK